MEERAPQRAERQWQPPCGHCSEVRLFLLPFSVRAEKRHLGDLARHMVSPPGKEPPPPLVLGLRWARSRAELLQPLLPHEANPPPAPHG